MQKREIAGIAILLTGLLFITPSITGAVIGTNAIPETTGFFLLLLGTLLLISTNGSENLEEIVDELKKRADSLVNPLHKEISEQKLRHPANPKYVQGLCEIDQAIHKELQNYLKNESPTERGLIESRLKRWNDAIKEREQKFFELPHHVKNVKDLPDLGLYNYAPIMGKRTRYIDLEVTHYTSQNAFNRIKKAYEAKSRQVLIQDENGWAYFVARELPEKLPTKTLRRILGTGLQFYVGKKRHRDPESQITLKIRIPKERVLMREATYNIEGAEPVNVRKYAIAGGITHKDIIESPVGGRYLGPNLEERFAKKQSWT